MSHLKFFLNCIIIEHKPKKVQTQSTNMIVYDMETFNTNGAVPYAKCI